MTRNAEAMEKPFIFLFRKISQTAPKPDWSKRTVLSTFSTDGGWRTFSTTIPSNGFVFWVFHADQDSTYNRIHVNGVMLSHVFDCCGMLTIPVTKGDVVSGTTNSRPNTLYFVPQK